jgi:hypothetical protein
MSGEWCYALIPAKKVFGNLDGRTPCGDWGEYEYRKRWYCARHHPPTVKARRSVARAEKNARMQDEARRVAEMNESARRAACYDDLLALVEEAIRLYGTPHWWNQPHAPAEWIARAQAAVAKARGTMSRTGSERSEG